MTDFVAQPSLNGPLPPPTTLTPSLQARIACLNAATTSSANIAVNCDQELHLPYFFDGKQIFPHSNIATSPGYTWRDVLERVKAGDVDFTTAATSAARTL